MPLAADISPSKAVRSKKARTEGSADMEEDTEIDPTNGLAPRPIAQTEDQMTPPPEEKVTLEAIRQIRYDLGDENVLYLHLTLVPYIKAAKELKTKPTQHSVKELRQIGIQPDILVCRTEHKLPDELRRKIALFCNVRSSCVVECQDVDSIYKVPLVLHEQGFDRIICDLLNIWTAAPELERWRHISQV